MERVWFFDAPYAFHWLDVPSIPSPWNVSTPPALRHGVLDVALFLNPVAPFLLAFFSNNPPAPPHRDLKTFAQKRPTHFFLLPYSLLFFFPIDRNAI